MYIAPTVVCVGVGDSFGDNRDGRSVIPKVCDKPDICNKGITIVKASFAFGTGCARAVVGMNGNAVYHPKTIL